MALLNYTTTIAPQRAMGEIQTLLAKAGAKRIMTDYDNDGNVAALSFQLILDGRALAFRLPAAWQPVQQVLQEQRRRNSRVIATPEQARRVAWRITKDWVEAQLAIIETQMVTTQQVFLPYAITQDGSTLYEHIAAHPGLLLGDGETA
ncbi:MAG: hypothetical protein ACT4NP_19765 [Pseudonocardiales bacterium]